MKNLDGGYSKVQISLYKCYYYNNEMSAERGQVCQQLLDSEMTICLN